MAENHMPAQSASQQPSHPSNNAFDSPPSYAHANATAQLPPIQTQGKNNGDTYHNNIILPPIPAVESLSLEDRPVARTYSDTMSYSQQHSNSNSQQNLPSLSSQSLPLPQPVEPPEPIQPRYQPPTSWPSSNPFVSYYRGPEAQAQAATTLHATQSQTSLNKNASPGVDSPGSAMDVDRERGSSALRIDDPDVRMAAEALGDLRADFVQTPPNGNSQRNGKRHSSNSRRSQPEPLLSLLTSHPLIGSAVNQSAAAYSAGKNYSPAFRCTAEYVERRVTPVVNRVSTVGRVTGVEGGVRWFLGGRRRHNRPRGNTSASNNDEQGSKRRKMREEGEGSSSRNSYASTYSYASAGQPELHASGRDRRDSQASSMVESLPAYDDFTSPSYAESQVQQRQGDSQIVTREDYRDDTNLDDSSWQRKLILSTSGLSIAMSDESLRSLRYCLTWLRWAGEHIGRVVAVLTGLLEQQERGSSQGEEADMNRRVQELKADVLKTLKDVVEIVSKYAGGALPENAKLLVRRHLTSLPARFKIAQDQSRSEEGSAEGSPRNSTDGATSPREGARRATLLAKEGIEMMNQVSGILDLTIVSAEEWRQKLGKNGDLKEPIVDSPQQPQQQPQQMQSMPNLKQTDYNEDYRMGEAM